MVRAPAELALDTFAEREGKDGSDQQALAREAGGGTIAGFREQRGHDDRQLLGLRRLQIRIICGTEEMNEIAFLPVIPPAKWFNLHPELFESRFGLFDLD